MDYSGLQYYLETSVECFVLVGSNAGGYAHLDVILHYDKE